MSQKTKHGGADPYADLSHKVERRNATPWIIAGAVVLVVIAAVVAVVLAGGNGDSTDVAAGTGAAAAAKSEQETATVTVQGEDLPEYVNDTTDPLLDPAQDPAVGRTIPTLTGESFDGSKVTIGPDGSPQVIVFVAHWCPHCQKEVPLIQQYIDEGKLPEGVKVSTVSTSVQSDAPNYPPSRWLVNEGWTPQVLLDDPSGTAAMAYGLSGFPYFVMADAEGKVVQRGAGEVPIEQFDAAVQQLAAGASPS